MQWLKDKTAIVTGGGRGIGKAIAKTFSEHGAKVVINYHNNADEAQKTLDEIKQSGGEAIIYKADISSLHDQEKLLNETLSKFGGVDILVNNAGITIRQPFFECTEEAFDAVINTNLKGTFFMSQLIAREMIKRKTAGSIVNISSILGLRPMARHLQYEIAKAGVTMLTQSLSKGLAGNNIRVNAISPGIIETDINQAIRQDFPETWSKIISNIPYGHPGTPEDIAMAAVYLASDYARFTTGANIIIDGGHSAYTQGD